MIVAHNANGERIFADEAVKGEKYFCPLCGEEVIVRQGHINIWHFAHKSNTDCEGSDMSEWHVEMQNLFPKEYQEVIVEHNGEKHRADVLKDGVVLEFQHSSIPVEDYCRRTDFWLSAGYRIAWILDARGFNIEYSDSPVERWKHPKRFLIESPEIGAYKRNFAIWFYRDNGEEPYFSKIIWAANNWSRIVFDSWELFAAGDLDAVDFVKSRQDHVDEITKGHRYKILRMGQKGYRYNDYVCPRRKEFGLSLYGEKGCSYCKHCVLIVGKRKGCDVYCTYPNVARPVGETHPGYECSGVERL